MQDILNQLKENPKIFDQLLNDDKNIEEIQKELLKQNYKVNKSTIKLIVHLTKNCIQNKNQPETIDEKDLENISGGIAVSKKAVDCIVGWSFAIMGAKVGSKIGKKFSEHGIFLNRTPLPENYRNEYPNYYWENVGIKKGINYMFGAGLGALFGANLQEKFKISERICDFLENHGVEIK